MPQQEGRSVGRVRSLSCEKQNPLRAQGQNGALDTLHRTLCDAKHCTIWPLVIRLSHRVALFPGSIQLDAGAVWDHVGVERAAAGQPVDMVGRLTRSVFADGLWREKKQKTKKQIPPRRDWTNYGQTFSSYLETATLCSVSPCSSSDASLWQNKCGERMYSDQDEGCWKCDNNPDCAEDASTPQQSSSVSFSGPYIFCQVGPQWELKLISRVFWLLLVAYLVLAFTSSGLYALVGTYLKPSRTWRYHNLLQATSLAWWLF